MALRRRATKNWDPSEEETLAGMRESGCSDEEIAEALARTVGSVKNKIHGLMNKEEQLTPRESALRSRQEIKQAALNPPINDADYAELTARIRDLESEIARLREQKKWETHSNEEATTGGLMTLRDSDRHTSDENHMLGCCASLEEKFCVLVERYEPDEILYVGMDDFVAGRGIYKDQDLHSAVTDPIDQLKVGAVAARRFFQKIRKVTAAPIGVEWLRGNHEYVGGTSIAEAFYAMTKDVCADVGDIAFVYRGDRAVLNCAHAGYHNILFTHGFGHSNQSPNSNAFVSTAQQMIIQWQRKRPPEQHIRRVASGHTHWHSLEFERIADLPFDTTGGLQRNTRVKLGSNQRPLGWNVYISPRGSDTILKPIALRPDQDTLERERADPSLAAANRAWCAECLDEYARLMRERGQLSDSDDLGITQGRW